MAITATGYLSPMFKEDKRAAILDWIREILAKPELEGVTAVAVRGMSGVIVGSIVSHVFGLKLIVIRKPEEHSHASYKVEGITDDPNLKYIIIDDLVSSGTTVKTILQRVRTANCDAKCIALLLYFSWKCDLENCNGLNEIKHVYGYRDTRNDY